VRNQRLTGQQQVFGNSNSLPISLVLSLSQTLKGLHWDKIPGDNDDEVAARGILYLMIFQQLGQLVRWSWGYHVLLAPKDKYEEYADEITEEGRYTDDPDPAADDDTQSQGLIEAMDEQNAYEDGVGTPTTDGSEAYEPAGRTPVASHSRTSLATTEDSYEYTPRKPGTPTKDGSIRRKHANGAHPPGYHSIPDEGIDGILSFPRIRNVDEQEVPAGVRGIGVRVKNLTRRTHRTVSGSLTEAGRKTWASLPVPVQKVLSYVGGVANRFLAFLWDFMNPPLWAMLLAIIVASVPDLQRLFFREGSFIKNSVTSAVTQSAGVAVPLILVVLGANLARNTQKTGADRDPEEKEIGTRLLVASLVCRMLLPTIIMAPILAVFAKYVPVSILDDPIFVIVCFLLTGAPSALQLAQICQINGVYETVMSKILFQSYVIWILPSTLVLVMCALEVVEWAA
jgi:auxin efflux carrier family protein